MNPRLVQPAFVEGDGVFLATPHVPAVSTILVALADRHSWLAATWDPTQPTIVLAWPGPLTPVRVPQAVTPRDDDVRAALTSAASHGLTKALTVTSCLVSKQRTYRVDLAVEGADSPLVSARYQFLDRSS